MPNAHAVIEGDSNMFIPHSLYRNADLGTLSIGTYDVTIDSFQAPDQPAIAHVTFRLLYDGFLGDTVMDTLDAMFVADREGLTSEDDQEVGSWSFKDGNGNGLDIRSVQELVNTFAPKLYFDSEENYFPQSVETTLSGAKIVDANSHPVDCLNNNQASVDALFEATAMCGTDGDSLWIDLPGTTPAPTKEPFNGDPEFALYATAIREDNQIAISYYIHYGYSNWKQHGGYTTPAYNM